jgi:hypothetical protein
VHTKARRVLPLTVKYVTFEATGSTCLIWEIRGMSGLYLLFWNILYRDLGLDERIR